MEKMILKLDTSHEKGLKILSILLGPIPFASGILDFTNEALTKKRLSILLEKLNRNELSINDAIIENDDFIHGVQIIINSVSKTHRNEKIEAYSNLLITGIEKQELTNDIDSFEYYVHLLDSINYYEMRILELLFDLDEKLVVQDSEMSRTEELLNMEIDHILTNINVDRSFITSILDKLTYSALIEKVQFSNFTFGSREVSSFYKVSNLYKELRRRIGNI